MQLNMKDGNSPGIVLYDEHGKSVLTVHAKTSSTYDGKNGVMISHDKESTTEFAQKIIDALGDV